jgi:hypothetical protein
VQPPLPSVESSYDIDMNGTRSEVAQKARLMLGIGYLPLFPTL